MVVYDPRLRALFEGVVASANEPAVYRSFQILFEDLLPLRITGRMIFGRLFTLLQEKYFQPQQAETERIVQALGDQQGSPGVSEEDVHHSRRLFLRIVEYCQQQQQDTEKTTNPSQESVLLQLSKQHLLDLGIINRIGTSLLRDIDNDDALVDALLGQPEQQQQQQKLAVDFETFFLFLSTNNNNNNEKDSSAASEHPYASARTVLERIADTLPPTNDQVIRFDAKRQKHVERYDFMVDSFKEWKDLVIDPSSSSDKESSRRLDVLMGCFVGAENPRVVQALQIVYVDYSALRVAGNLIFKIMSTLIRSRAKR